MTDPDEMIVFHLCAGCCIQVRCSRRTACALETSSSDPALATTVFSSKPIPENYTFCVKLEYPDSGRVKIGLTKTDPGRALSDSGSIRIPWYKSCCLSSANSLRRLDDIIYAPEHISFEKTLPFHDQSNCDIIGVSWCDNRIYLHRDGKRVKYNTICGPLRRRLSIGERDSEFVEHALGHNRCHKNSPPYWAVLTLDSQTRATIVTPFPKGCELNAAVAEEHVDFPVKLLYDGCPLYRTDNVNKSPWDYLRFRRINFNTFKLTKLLCVAGMNDPDILVKLIEDSEKLFYCGSITSKYVVNLLETATIIDPVLMCSLLSSMIDKYVGNGGRQQEFVSLVQKFREDEPYLSLKVLCAHAVWTICVNRNLGISVYPVIRSLHRYMPSNLVNFILGI